MDINTSWLAQSILLDGLKLYQLRSAQLQIPIYELLQQYTSDHEAFQARIDKLVELDEVRRMPFEKIVID